MNAKKLGLAFLIIVASLAALSQVIAAQTSPPAAAITACEGQNAGDACQFTAQGGATISGTCQMVQDVLACVPGDQATATPTSETPAATGTGSFSIVDTNQDKCYSDSAPITCPQSGAAYDGQDAQHDGFQPSYQDNGDGTVTDLNTGLMWQQTPDSEKSTFAEAAAGAATFDLAGYDDWRLPSIKELYSLIDFSGNTQPTIAQSTPFIDTDYFDFEYGDESAGERIIDAQYWSATEYVGTTMYGNPTAFGVNFADGRIKGYGTSRSQFVRYVRGNTDYGVNDFVNNGDNTISDQATSLMWQKVDSGSTFVWDGALSYCNELSLAGHDDWRLPNAKELQSIVDYTRAPDAAQAAQQSAAIDPIFDITNEDSYFWSSTTHMDGPNYWGAYLAFGQAWGYMEDPQNPGTYDLLNVHGAGAQRSDPKTGNPADWPNGNGPQGDVVRIYNYARCVRDAETTTPLPDLSYKVYMPHLSSNSASIASTDPTSTDYNLFAPLASKQTYLIDDDGNVVYTWNSNYRPGNAVYLLQDGDLLRTGKLTANTPFSSTGGVGGVVQLIEPDGTVSWEYEYASSAHQLHHDVEILPNGNILMIAWELKTQAQAISAGRDPSLLSDGTLWPDHVIEVNPGDDSIVWEWHAWDHLIQDYEDTQANYGVVGDHPELIDLNYVSGGPKSDGADWNHVNSIDYNAELDQILLSVHNFSEIWIIDHSTSTAQAASHSGGNSGQGGDLLYRWGNPQTYDAGSPADQQLFVQHDAQWIESGSPGAGNILIFNNGQGRSDGDYSSVDEIVPPVDGVGAYTLSGSAYGPAAPTWSYTDANPTDFYATNISGAQRLSNGNTLICDGPSGYFFQVTAGKQVVWSYQYSGNPSSVFRVTRYAADYVGLP